MSCRISQAEFDLRGHCPSPYPLKPLTTWFNFMIILLVYVWELIYGYLWIFSNFPLREAAVSCPLRSTYFGDPLLVLCRSVSQLFLQANCFQRWPGFLLFHFANRTFLNIGVEPTTCVFIKNPGFSIKPWSHWSIHKSVKHTQPMRGKDLLKNPGFWWKHRCWAKNPMFMNVPSGWILALTFHFLSTSLK